MRQTFIMTHLKHSIGGLICVLLLTMQMVFPGNVAAASGSFELGSANYSVNEGAGKVDVLLKRTGSTSGAATVQVRTLGDTADWKTDYNSMSWTTVSFADGQAQKVLSIGITDDTAKESSEVFNVLLRKPTDGTTLGSVTTSAVTIVDNDSQPGSFQFAASTYSVDESAGKVDVVLQRVGGSAGAATVEVRTNGITADYATDYDSFSWTVVNFADGQTQKVISIGITDDNVTENKETFTVNLGNPTGGTSLGTVTESTVTIVDNDVTDTTAPVAKITSPLSGTTVTSDQTVNIVASASDNVGVVKVEFYVDGKLIGTDTTNTYSASMPISSSANGTCTITAVAYDAAGNTSQSAPVSLSVKIPVASTEPGSFEFGASSYSVSEAGGKVDVVVKRVGGSSGAATVQIRTNGNTATYDADYGSFSWTTMSFADGETQKVKSIAIVNDSIVEPDETFTVNLGSPTVATLGSITSTVVTIKNDDTSSSSSNTSGTSSSTSTVFYGYNKTAGAGDDPHAAPYGGVSRYVSPSGSDNNSGSVTSPWKSIQYAMTHANAGDTIYLRGGVYNSPITINGNVSATATKPLEVRSYPGEWAIIDGTNTTGGNLFRFFNESWVIFRNFEVRNSDKTRLSNGFYVENVTDCQWHNIYMHDNNGAGFSAEELYRSKFYNCTASNNVDIQSAGDSADGFSVTSGEKNEFYRCVAIGNSDDAYDNWAASGHYYEDCIAANSGSGAGGDGNGFKLGKPDPAPYAGLRGGNHTLVRCIALGNRFRGYSENATTNGSVLTGCIAYSSGQNWELPSAPYKVTNCISFGGNGDKIGSSTTVVASKGQGFGGTVYTSDFESVDLADMNNQSAGHRFFYAKVPLF